MSKPIKFQTKKCVRCLKKPAKFWTGHVLVNGEHILAGWCGKRCRDTEGFRGHFRGVMGRKEIDW